MCVCVYFASLLGHKHLDDEQYSHQQTTGHHAPCCACQPVWLTHWQGWLQDQGNQRGLSHPVFSLKALTCHNIRFPHAVNMAKFKHEERTNGLSIQSHAEIMRSVNSLSAFSLLTNELCSKY